MRKLSLSLSFLMVLSSFYLHPSEPTPRPFVTCYLNGQLGNQLFEVASTLAYAWDHNVDPIFPELHRPDLNIPMNYNRVFFRLNDSPLPRPVSNLFAQNHVFTKEDIPYRPDQDLRGFFQSWRYFDHHRERIVETFTPCAEELEHIKFKHAALLNHPLTVGVHVRTFNKEWSGVIPFVGVSYYEKAMSFFPPEALFIVFSDRINWCKHHLRHIKRPMIFIDDQDHIADLFLMSMLKHNILANSTFSWWAAYMNQNPDKIVITPSHWLNPKFATTCSGGIEANMTDWIVLDIDWNAHYPDDMRTYDNYSKCMDTQ